MKKTLVITMAIVMLISVFGMTLPHEHAYAANDITVTVDGKTLQFDVPPQIIGGKTMVPMRKIFEELDIELAWNAETKTVAGTKDGTMIVLTIGSSTALANGKSVTLDTPAQIINGSTLVPVRFIAESLGANVDWDSGSRTVIIASDNKTESYPTSSPPPTPPPVENTPIEQNYSIGVGETKSFSSAFPNASEQSYSIGVGETKSLSSPFPNASLFSWAGGADVFEITSPKNTSVCTIEGVKPGTAVLLHGTGTDIGDFKFVAIFTITVTNSGNTASMDNTADKPPTTTVSNPNWSPASDFTFTSADDGSGYAVSKYGGAGGAVVIPGEYNGKSVTQIGGEAFKDNTRIKSVAIPKGVTFIGPRAFSGCEGLTDVTIPEGVTLIGLGAFNKCAGLTQVTLPDSINIINRTVFANCSNLKTVIIGQNAEQIGADVFLNCYNLTAIYFRGNAPGFVGEYFWTVDRKVNQLPVIYYAAGKTGWPTTKIGYKQVSYTSGSEPANTAVSETGGSNINTTPNNTAPAFRTCPICFGERRIDCTICDGSGRSTTFTIAPSSMTQFDTCYGCGGSGKVTCMGCGGLGELPN